MNYFIIIETRNYNWIKSGVGLPDKTRWVLGVCAWVSKLGMCRISGHFF